MKQKTKEEFINDSNIIHNHKYDYSLVEYNNNKTKVKIICDIHGIFEQTPNSHLRNRGCPCCGGTKKLTKNEFIKKSNKIHYNKYNYEYVIYNNIMSNIIIKCPIHGEFKQLPIHHLNGCGCPCCGGTKKLMSEEFIKKSKDIHGDKYDYSLVNYVNNRIKVKIICKEHGIFQQTPNEHLSKCGCPKCSKNKKLTKNEFIKKSKLIHGDKYDYSLVKYINSYCKIKIICPNHGIFEQLPKDHIHNKHGCPKCKYSKGEKKIRDLLNYYNIIFIEQKKFNGCKHIKSLPFDFYLPDFNLCIEYDGEQHFNENHYFNM